MNIGFQITKNADKYKKLILPILEEQNIPPEIFYVSVIESGLGENSKPGTGR